jgi:hypothetical protein
MQRWPIKKMKEMTAEMIHMTHDNGRRKMIERKSLHPPIRTWTNLPRLFDVRKELNLSLKICPCM